MPWHYEPRNQQSWNDQKSLWHHQPGSPGMRSRYLLSIKRFGTRKNFDVFKTYMHFDQIAYTGKITPPQQSHAPAFLVTTIYTFEKFFDQTSRVREDCGVFPPRSVGIQKNICSLQLFSCAFNIFIRVVPQHSFSRSPIHLFFVFKSSQIWHLATGLHNPMPGIWRKGQLPPS